MLFSRCIFSRVLRDCTPSFVDPSVGRFVSRSPVGEEEEKVFDKIEEETWL